MAHKQNRPSLFVADLIHLSHALFLEFGVADGEDFVDEEDFGVEMGGYGEGEADVHAAGVAFYGGIQELFDLGEVDDGVEVLFDLGFAHAEDRAVQVDIFAPRELGMEAGADLEQACHSAFDRDSAGRGFGDAAEDLEQRRLARAVAADDAHALALFDVEGDVLQRPEFLRPGSRGFLSTREGMEDFAAQLFRAVDQDVTERDVFLRLFMG